MSSSLRTFAGAVAFEWRYAMRRLPFAAASLLLAGVGFALAATEFGPAELHLNGPWIVTYSIGYLTLVSVFAATLLAAPALLRDVEHRMAEVIWASGVGRRTYLLARVAGATLTGAVALLVGVAGLAAGTLLTAHDPARLAPFSLGPYVWGYLTFGLPGLLLATATLFAVAAWTRSAPATYVAGILLYVLYFVAALFAGSPLIAGNGPGSPNGLSLAALLDPFGLSAFLDETRHWVAAERDARLVPLSGAFLVSRLVCCGAAIGALAAVLARFRFRVGKPARGHVVLADQTPSMVRAEVELRTVTPRAPGWDAWRSVVRLELRLLGRSGALWALFALWLGTLAIETVQTFRRGELGTAQLPGSGALAEEMAGSLALFGLLFLVYFAAEVVWRERLVRIAEVVDAAPASSLVAFAGKLTALLSVLVGLALSAVGVAVLFQAGTTGMELAPWPWLALFGSTLLSLAQVAVLVLLVQAVAPQRHVGIVLALAAVAFFHRGAFGGPEHPLARYAYAPRLAWSDFTGVLPPLASLAWFAAFWSAVAVLLALLAWGLWPRGTDARRFRRRRATSLRWGRSGWTVALLAASAALLVGVTVFRGTNVRNRYETAEELLAWKADYERAYRRVAAFAQPVVTHLAGVVEIEPTERRVRFAGRARLTNRTEATVAEVWVVVRRDLHVKTLRLAGEAPVALDPRFATYRFSPAPPLAPGASAELELTVELKRQAPAAGDDGLDVLPGATYLHGLALVPTIGYRTSYEITAANERRRFGLPSRASSSGAGDDDLPAAPERMTFDVTVITPASQRAVAPGERVSSRTEGERRSTRFRAAQPVSAFFAVGAAAFEVERREHRGIEVEVSFHPRHRRNVPRVLAAATRALDLCTSRYGPYPLPQLRIAEVPATALGGAGGFALPGLVLLSERRAFGIDAEAPGRIDLLTKRVAHEVAHQWWGHQLDPAAGPGAAALVESLARHTELRVLAAVRGGEQVGRVLELELERYLAGRVRGDEVPLVEVDDQPYLYYAKGSLAMAALVELAGEAKVDGVLRELLAEAKVSGNAPNAHRLLAKLLAATPAEHRALVEEWWQEVVLYDLRANAASATRLADGRWRVDLDLFARRRVTRPGGAGLEEETPTETPFELRVIGTGEAAPILLARNVRLEGATSLSVVVDQPPVAIELDPRHLVLDADRGDNVRSIEIRGDAPSRGRPGATTTESALGGARSSR